jgi:hypothetical protein
MKTYYKIQNTLTGQAQYFVDNQETVDAYPYLNCVIGTLEDAENALREANAAYLEKEMYRFSMCKEIVNGSDTVWMTANLVEDVEEHIYFVFNHVTGLHEKISGFSAAKARYNDLVEEFKSQLPTAPIAVHVLPTPKYNNVTNIPTEIL